MSTLATTMETPSNSEDQTETHKASEVDPLIPKPSSPSRWRSKRFIVGLLLFFGYFVNALAHQVINITVVKMTRRIQEEELTEFSSKDTSQNPILNMYWYGFMFSAIGGHLAQRFGGSVVLGISTLLSGIFTVATWFSVLHGFDYLMACHVFVGIFQGFSSASYSAVFASWAPKEERYNFMFYVIHGLFFGDTFVYLLYGCLNAFWEWPMVFPIIGFLSITWAFVWLILVQNTPSDDPWISKSELHYILEGTGNPVPIKSDLPYRKIFKSSSFWALVIAQFTFTWVRALRNVYLPFFIRDVRGEDIGLGVLFVFSFAHIPIINEFFRRLIWLDSPKKGFSKHEICFGFLGAGILFHIISFILDIYMMSFFEIAKLHLSYNKMYLDIVTVNMAPNHAALLSGLSSFWQAIGIITIQTVVGLKSEGGCSWEWYNCFILTAYVLMASDGAFMFFGSNRPQPWSVSPSSENDCEEGYNPTIGTSSKKSGQEEIQMSLPKKLLLKMCRQIHESW